VVRTSDVKVHHPGDATHIKSGLNSVVNVNKGMESTTDSASNDSYEAVLRPSAPLQRLWKTAISKGAPENAVANNYLSS